ncbi:MAG: GerMN domain-containing protein [bacterium]|nr:GerMN domain-containing protein [bacterium]
MSRQTVLIAITLTAVLVAVVTIVSCEREVEPGEGSEPIEETATEGEEELEALDLTPADLYFPSAGGWLRAERREVPSSEAVAEGIVAVVEALLAGPGVAETPASGLYAPLPEGVTVRRVYLAERTAFLDLQSPEGAPPPPSGSRQEILTVYSVVNTVLLNFEEVEQLVLLWNGRQPRTFAGHLDTMRPLSANTDLIARAP